MIVSCTESKNDEILFLWNFTKSVSLTVRVLNNDS